MPTIRDTALCIRHWEFSETSQTVALFCREHGVLRGLAKGSRREKGAFSGGIDVLTRGEVVAIVKPGRDLATLTAWHLQDLFPAVRRRIGANRAGLYLADLIHQLLEHHDPHPALFDATVDALHTFEHENRIACRLLLWQWQFLAELGYRPEVQHDAKTGGDLPDQASAYAFSPRDGGIVEDTGRADVWRVRPETVAALRTIDHAAERGGALDEHTERAIPADSVDRANRLLATYLRDILGREPATMRFAFPDMGSPIAVHRDWGSSPNST